MQDDPRYGDVLYDVYDALAARVAQAEAAGIPRARILLDIGIGFGKTLAHNLELLRGIALFHTLGCSLLLAYRANGLSARSAARPRRARGCRGDIGGHFGCVGGQGGVQMHRVHDVNEVAQGIALWRAVNRGDL